MRNTGFNKTITKRTKQTGKYDVIHKKIVY